MSALKRKKRWGSVPKMKVGVNENRFKILQSLDEEDGSFSEDEHEQVHDYKIVIPPIVVDGTHGFSKVLKLIGTDFEFKRMSVGTKIISSSMTNYDLAKKKLSEANYKFYTHDCKDTKLFKLFLYGLPRIDPKEIVNELKMDYNVTVNSVKEIATSRSSADDALYMLEFDRTQNTKSQILKIKRLCRIVVYWRNPLKSRKGPTQCTKCTMYGHGSKNCFRHNIGDHDLSVCQINKIPDGNSAAFKCFNCTNKNLKHTNHRADDPRCPSRKEYIAMRVNINKRNQNPRNQRFPEIVYQNHNVSSQFVNASNSIRNENLPSRSYADAVRTPVLPTNQENCLFSIDELFNIFTRAVSDLQKCTSKIEQLNVIMQMLRYAI